MSADGPANGDDKSGFAGGGGFLGVVTSLVGGGIDFDFDFGGLGSKVWILLAIFGSRTFVLEWASTQTKVLDLPL